MRKKYFKKNLIKNSLFLILGVGVILIGVLIVWVTTLKLPDFKSLNSRKIESSTKIYDRTGNFLLYDIHKDIKRTVIPYQDMGINIRNATVAIEDSEFYQHRGIRLKSILRATLANLLGRSIQGGSTITQQLVKNTLLTPKKSLSRKIKEWIISVRVEQIMSKEEILSLYLNEAPYGGNIYGIREASVAFFGKEPKDLTLAESAYLAAIPNGPTYYSPYRKNRDKLEDRKNIVLNRMFALGFINKEDYDMAIKEGVVFLPEKLMGIEAPHFVFFIKDYLEKKYGEDFLEKEGLKVITTLDYDLQKKAEEITLTQTKENEKICKESNNKINCRGSNAAVVVMDPKTGQILSMVGSRNYFDKDIDGNFNVVTAARQPGSSFKPIVYSLAFEKGYTEKTTLFDVKTEFNATCDPTGEDSEGSWETSCYSPDNYDGSFRGPMTLRDALAQSINIIAVKLLYLVGVNDSIKLAHELGISTLNDPDSYGLTVVIGGGETTLLDMTSVYGVFAAEGTRHPYRGILSIEDGRGTVLEKYEEKSFQILKANTTKIISSILSDNIARTPTFGANSSLVVPSREVAVKTGTTNDNKDAWTIGYTPSVVVGVWVGNNDNTPMKKGGAALAGPIWNKVITEAVKNLPNESFGDPDPIDQSIPAFLRGFWQGGTVFVVDSLSGGLATEYTPENTKKEVVITDVHTILHWIDKKNILLKKPTGIKNDPQYKNWEYGVANWWANNRHKYSNTLESNIPNYYDNIHTENSKPSFVITGISSGFYKKDDLVSFTINPKTRFDIKRVDVFVNDSYLKSMKSSPYNISFYPKDIENISNNNNIKIVGSDTMGNVGETVFYFSVENN